MPDFKEISFEQFWKLYPRKESKGNAEKAFNRLNRKDKLDAYNALPENIKHWTNRYKQEEWSFKQQFIPYPSTYLNGRRWEDELYTPDVKKSFQLDASGNSYLGYCSRCNISDFYHKDDLTGDSRCCKAELMPERRRK